MLNSLRLKKASLLIFILLTGCSKQKAEEKQYDTAHYAVAPPYLQVDTVNILSKKKLELTVQYNKENYGLESYRLDTPRMVVVHYTAFNKLESTFNTFIPDRIATARDYIKDFSSLNVGIHYVVAQDGKIYSLMPDTVVARHLIGFNHVSLGIENVASDSTELTAAQLESNAKLVRFLTNKYSTIEYLIGHHEYSMDTLPHFKLFKELNPNYKFSGKIDPGDAFMSKLRTKLASDGVVLKK